MEQSNELESQPSIEPIKKIVAPIEIKTDNVTPVHEMGGGYVEFENKLFQKDALKEIRPDLFRALPDSNIQGSNTKFGNNFPRIAGKGDIFVRTDVLPNRVYKFDGRRWIEVNKNTTTSYLSDNEYLSYIVGKIGSGEYDIDQFTDDEKDIIEEYLKNQNT